LNLVKRDLLKRDLLKRDIDLSETLSFDFLILSQYKSRWLRGTVLQAGPFSYDSDVPLKEGRLYRLHGLMPESLFCHHPYRMAIDAEAFSPSGSRPAAF
jgi:hypothetical protein